MNESFVEVARRVLEEQGYKGKYLSDEELNQFNSIYDIVIYYLGRWK